MHHFRMGHGPKLLLIHGLGSNGQGWGPLLPLLSRDFELVVPDLPGFGRTPMPAGEMSLEALADALADFIHAQGLRGAACAGFSLGGQLALELLRRGLAGPTAALAPGGFWMGWERLWIAHNITAGVLNVRMVKPLLPAIAALPLTRSLLFAQFCARPWAAAPGLAEGEARSEAEAPGTDPLFRRLLVSPMQRGLDPGQALPAPLSILWGREDRVTLPQQAGRAVAAFPGAALHWIPRAGHYVHWDQPEEATRIIRATCAPMRALAA